MISNESESDFVPGSGLRKLVRLTNFSDPVRYYDFDLHLRPLFAEVKAQKASDIFIQEGKPIIVMVKGDCYALSWRIIDKKEAQFFLKHIACDTALSSLSNKLAVNTKFGLFDADKSKKNLAGHRTQDGYRVNAMAIMIEGTLAFQMVLRSIPADPLPFSAIGLEENFVKQCCPAVGIIYITGVTGSGKSTTLSSIIRYILQNHTLIRGNIISIEDPIEFTYENIPSAHSFVAQSQIPECIPSFKAAIKEAMRRKPAAIIVGEVRDYEAISESVTAAVSGHPAFATAHAGSVLKVLPRLVAQYPESEQNKALYDIITSTAGIISQRLVHRVNGDLMAVQEYVMFSKEIKDEMLSHTTVRDANEVLAKQIQNGKNDKSYHASLSFAAQGKQLFKQGIITQEGLLRLSADE